jgi:pimeloyl-ACP methyl ester carboxylesterase
MRVAILALFCLLVGTGSLQAQQLKPGFDKAEYVELLRLHARIADTTFFGAIPRPARFRMVYRSPVVGLDNRWDLWTSPDATAVISIRGTTQNSVSWLENFYAAMLPATGELRLSPTRTFKYALATNPQAAVHAGWLLGTAFLADDILVKVDSLYKRGTRDIIIMGHSQGGALAYLFTAHVRSLQKQGRVPADIRFKTYCSAGPKPGNLYFAYDYETATHGGWAFNVVNPADWVPEFPLSVQTVRDFNPVNPFVGAKSIIRKQKFPKRVALNFAYNQLARPSQRAQRRYQRYLGNFVSREIKKQVPDYQGPAFYPSNNYVRTGTPIVLPAESTYYRKFPNDQEKLFGHHLFQSYYYLAERLP